jgi:hypothetical protein
VGKDGEYRASFAPREKGRHEVRVEAFREGQTLGRDTAHVQAADTDAEYFGAEMRRPLLERIAAETGGRFYTPDTVGSLASDVGYSGGGATVEETRPLWDMPALFLAIVALVSAEWGYRKRRGLA